MDLVTFTVRSVYVWDPKCSHLFSLTYPFCVRIRLRLIHPTELRSI